jgi:hypothetical protein
MARHRDLERDVLARHAEVVCRRAMLHALAREMNGSDAMLLQGVWRGERSLPLKLVVSHFYQLINIQKLKVKYVRLSAPAPLPLQTYC